MYIYIYKVKISYIYISIAISSREASMRSRNTEAYVHIADPKNYMSKSSTKTDGFRALKPCQYLVGSLHRKPLKTHHCAGHVLT